MLDLKFAFALGRARSELQIQEAHEKLRPSSVLSGSEVRRSQPRALANFGTWTLALIPLLCGLTACTPEPPPKPRLKLDCALTYEALSAKVMAHPGLVQQPAEKGEPYRFYTVPDASEAFIFTEPGAPGHPAILKQEVVRASDRSHMRNTGCPYGDQAGFDEVLAYLESMSRRD